MTNLHTITFVNTADDHDHDLDHHHLIRFHLFLRDSLLGLRSLCNHLDAVLEVVGVAFDRNYRGCHKNAVVALPVPLELPGLIEAVLRRAFALAVALVELLHLAFRMEVQTLVVQRLALPVDMNMVQVPGPRLASWAWHLVIIQTADECVGISDSTPSRCLHQSRS